MPSPRGSVTFANVKPKYYLNDDILLEYVLMDPKFQPSYRDFIGLYPRGWNNVLQYVAFEWIMTNSIEMSPRRNIFFNCRYHSQFVYTDKEYQFVYFSHKIQVLARSRYFKFIPTKPAEKVKKNVHKESSDKVLSSSIPLIADTFSHISPNMSASAAEMLYGDQKSVSFMQSKDEMYRQACNSQVIQSPNYIPDSYNLDSQKMKSTTYETDSPADMIDQILHKQQNVDKKEKSSSAWIHKLENRNRNLEERIEDLENELQISVLTQKQLRLEAHYLKREKLAYQKFIQGLVNALSQKGIARVIDNKGREMDLVVVPKEYDDVHSNTDNMKSPEHLVDEFAPVVQK